MKIFSCQQAMSMKNVLIMAIAIFVLVPMISGADDIDIYGPSASAGHQPKIMIMLDTSTSMSEKAKAGQQSRIDRIKTPIQEFFRTASGADVGLSTFNGVNQGGRILYPAMDLNTDLCPDAACESITVRSQIQREDDDGHEKSDTGSVLLASSGASLGGRVRNNGSRGYYVDEGGQTVVQTSGSFVEAEVLPLSMTQDGKSASIGLHFPEINIPKNAHVHYAYVHFEWAGQEWLNSSQGGGVAKTRIYMDNRVDSPSFKDSIGYRVTDRPKTTEYMNWSVKRPATWNDPVDQDRSIRTSNFQNVFNEVFGNDLTTSATIIIEPDAEAIVSAENTVNLLGSHTREGESPTARLVFGFTYDPYVPSQEIAARRFDALNIPQGAVITSAHMEFSYRGAEETEEAFLNIRAEDSGDSEPFAAVKRNITDRERTTAYVDWDVPLWRYHNERHKSPDISNIIQEVVSRDDWCAGNALTMILEGSGERHTYMYRAGKEYSSSLHITYDPASVNRSNNCTILSGGNVDVYKPSDEIIQTRYDGNKQIGEIYDSTVDRYYAMRFEDIDLDADDDVGDARLQLTQFNDTIGVKIAYIFVDTDTGDDPLSLDGAIGSRFKDGFMQWMQIPAIGGFRTESVDISSMIQEAIQQPSWYRGAALTVAVRVRAPNMQYQTSLGAAGEGPTLSISRRVRGSDAALVPLRTARDEITESLDQLVPFGNTPIVDSFYETALYLTGGDVLHGKKRGEQTASNAAHRLSTEMSYTGGYVSRPLGCYADSPDSESCASEFIAGDPVYTAPDSVECKPNQIILVTDGAPTYSPAGTAAQIRTTVGDSNCSSSNPADECAIELASWLYTGSDDRHPILVSTIGFDFSSDFLDAIAESGGGKSYSVASSGQVREALRQIGEGSAFSSGSIVAPVAPVNQYTRSSHRGDLYFGLFQPASGVPLWAGNIKKYHLGSLDDGSIGIVDADGNAVVDTETGLISNESRSGWALEPDGANIVKGGAADKIKLNRKVLTSPFASNGYNAGPRELVDFDTDTALITASDMGVTFAERDNAILWMRGQDIKDADNDGVTTEARRSMGAAIHTTPGVLNFSNSSGDDHSILFAGTQEGYLHAIDTNTGLELWSFLPHELYKNIGLFYGDSSSGSHHYGLDGAITARFEDLNNNGLVDSGESAYVTVGMRRGGKHYYTLDVSDFDNPSLAWTIDPQRLGFEDLGQTWSKPVSAEIPVVFEGQIIRKRVLIFGNGYHTVNDLTERSNTTDHTDKGAIYVVDDATGSLLYKFDDQDHSGMVWSIPSDTFVVDKELDGDSDVVFVGDLGGNLWRIDFGISRDAEGDIVTNRPILTLAARLADRPMADSIPTGAATAGADRRFFHAPDVAIVEDDSGQRYFGVSIGSGRRDNPFLTGTTNRLFFMRMNIDSPGSAPLTAFDLRDATSTELVVTGEKSGWWIDLEGDGEKMLGSPVLFDGILMGTTYLPPSSGGSVCEPDIGTGRYYAIDVAAAKGVLNDEIGNTTDEESSSKTRYLELSTEGIPPPVSVFISDIDPSKPVVLVGTEVLEGASESPVRWQTYWIEE